MVCCCWDWTEEESILAGAGLVKVLDKPPMAPRKRPMAQMAPTAIRRIIPTFIEVVYNRIHMMRILFLGLCFLLCFGPQGRAAIEIYADGHKYDSFQAYLAFKKLAATRSALVPVTLSSQQRDYVRQQAQQLGVEVDPGKIKTFQINQNRLSNAALHKLYVLSVEHGMVSALQDFYQAWGQPAVRITRSINAEQLQEAIQEQVTVSRSPKLLISEPGKVRIMALAPQGR